MDIIIFWFLICVLVIVYAVLDGFDLGVGALSLFIHSDKEYLAIKRTNTYFLDGNELWLLTAGIIIYTVFPPAYAALMNLLYIPLIIFIVFLVLRAVIFLSLQLTKPGVMRDFLDRISGVGSLLPAFIFGFTIGNILHGFHINEGGYFNSSFSILLNPFAILTGFLSLSIFILHGAIFITIKTKGTLNERMIRRVKLAWFFNILLIAAIFCYIFFLSSSYIHRKPPNILFWVMLVFLFDSIVSIPLALHMKMFRVAFAASSEMIISTIGLAAVCMYPQIVRSDCDPTISLTIFNSFSLPQTPKIIMMLILIPILIIYRIFIHCEYIKK